MVDDLPGKVQAALYRLMSDQCHIADGPLVHDLRKRNRDAIDAFLMVLTMHTVCDAGTVSMSTGIGPSQWRAWRCPTCDWEVFAGLDSAPPNCPNKCGEQAWQVAAHGLGIKATP